MIAECAIGILSLLVSSVSPALAVSPVNLEGVTVHLFLEASGEFSRDVASIPFEGRNSKPFGVGLPENETFDSLLIKVAFSAPGEHYEPGVVATIRILGKRTGKAFVNRTVRGLYVGPSGRTHVPVFVASRPCEPLTIEVRSGGQSIRKTLEFSCGE